MTGQLLLSCLVRMWQWQEDQTKLLLQDKLSGFQDNDSLAKELAKELNADLLVLLTNVDGLMDGPPKDRNSK